MLSVPSAGGARAYYYYYYYYYYYCLQLLLPWRCEPETHPNQPPSCSWTLSQILHSNLT